MSTMKDIVRSLATCVAVSAGLYSSSKTVVAEKKYDLAKTEEMNKAVKSAKISLAAACVSASLHISDAVMAKINNKKVEDNIINDADEDTDVTEEAVPVAEPETTVETEGTSEE